MVYIVISLSWFLAGAIPGFLLIWRELRAYKDDFPSLNASLLSYPYLIGTLIFGVLGLYGAWFVFRNWNNLGTLGIRSDQS